jgi:hypothetical protein
MKTTPPPTAVNDNILYEFKCQFLARSQDWLPDPVEAKFLRTLGQQRLGTVTERRRRRLARRRWQQLHSTRKAMAYVNVSGGVAGDPIHHINLFLLTNRGNTSFLLCYMCTVPLSAAPTGFVFISLVCWFGSILNEVARAKSGSLRPNRLPIR